MEERFDKEFPQPSIKDKQKFAARIFDETFRNGKRILEGKDRKFTNHTRKFIISTLKDYKNKVKKNRLNPLYSFEWIKVRRCSIYNGPDMTVIVRIKNPGFKRKRLLRLKNPFLSLSLPSSIRTENVRRKATD